jgi:hypothetical protein
MQSTRPAVLSLYASLRNATYEIKVSGYPLILSLVDWFHGYIPLLNFSSRYPDLAHYLATNFVANAP